MAKAKKKKTAKTPSKFTATVKIPMDAGALNILCENYKLDLNKTHHGLNGGLELKVTQNEYDVLFKNGIVD